MKYFVYLLFLPMLALLALSSQTTLVAQEWSVDQAEADQLARRLVSPEILKTLENFENDPDLGIPVEVTRETLSLDQLLRIFRLFREAQEQHFVLRQENIEKLVIGSTFATNRTESTFMVQGIEFRQLRLIINADADEADLMAYFANPLGYMRSARIESAEDLSNIEELEGFYVSLVDSLNRPRALTFFREFQFGQPLQLRLIGSTGLDTYFSQYNFRFEVIEVENGRLASLDPRTGEVFVEPDQNFYGNIRLHYRVTLFGERSTPGVVTLQIRPPLMAVAESFDLRAGRPVDILYVVDNSSGTEEQQATLGESFVRFIAAFGEYNRRIRIAAIATSSTDAWRGELLSLPSGEQMIESSDPRFSEKVQKLIQPGAEKERRQSAILPTNNFFASGPGREFLRDDAFFAMIIISQKDDDYLETGDPERIMNVYRNTMRVMKRPSDMRIDAVVRYGTRTWFGRSSQGKVYAQLAEEFGGRVIDITRDFSQDLTRIGVEISRRAQQAFPLVEPLYIGAIDSAQVFVDGQLVSRNPVDGWTYEPESNRILLHGAALEASFGKIVRVLYSTIDRGRFQSTHDG